MPDNLETTITKRLRALCAPLEGRVDLYRSIRPKENRIELVAYHEIEQDPTIIPFPSEWEETGEDTEPTLALLVADPPPKMTRRVILLSLSLENPLARRQIAQAEAFARETIERLRPTPEVIDHWWEARPVQEVA